MYNGELYHFGIKGMKWGVRRFEDKSGHLTPAGKKRYNDYPTDRQRKKYGNHAMESHDYKDYGDGRIEIKEGTKMQRIIFSHAGSKTSLAGITYASFTKFDNMSYAFIGGRKDTNDKKNKNRVLDLVTKKELKSPSMDEAANTFMNLVKNKEFNNLYGNTPDGKQLGFPLSEKNIKDVSSNKNSLDTLYIAFNSTLVSNEPNNAKVRDMYFNELSKKGYNMLRDENDRNNGMGMKAPVILFDGASAVDVRSDKILGRAQLKDARKYGKQYYKKGEEWMRKKGLY